MSLSTDLEKFTSPDNILEGAPLSEYTTFRAGGPCAALVSPENTEELRAVTAFLEERGVPYFVIGRGSDLLVSDSGFSGVVISLRKHFSGVSVSGANLTAGAGALLSKAADEAASASLSGFEFASGIPGTVGGAVRMNAGAYGREIRDCIESADVLLPGGEIRTFSKDDLDLSYRHSVIEEVHGIVLQASFRLTPGDPALIRALMDDLNGRRREKQPLELASAGSTFKRPEGYFAGKLIEDAGLKGYRFGQAGVSEKHAGFVVNYGGATASEIMKVIKYVQQEVFRKFNVVLTPEVRFLGEFPEGGDPENTDPEGPEISGDPGED